MTAVSQSAPSIGPPGNRIGSVAIAITIIIGAIAAVVISRAIGITCIRYRDRVCIWADIVIMKVRFMPVAVIVGRSIVLCRIRISIRAAVTVMKVRFVSVTVIIVGVGFTVVATMMSMRKSRYGRRKGKRTCERHSGYCIR